MKIIKVAINGVGRIGRAFLRVAILREDINIVAINDLGDIDNIAYLLKYDTVYGQKFSSVVVSPDKKKIIIDDKEITFFSEKDPSLLPWKDLDIDVVVESTGFFTTYEKARAHVTAGAKKVVITAPAHDDPAGNVCAPDEGTILTGVNCDSLSEKVVTSNASCTTNAGSPVLKILNDAIGIEKAVLNTVHGYTASQNLVDGPNAKDWKEGRAAAVNIVPTKTGAALATTKAMTELAGKFDGIAMRVPVVCGSIADITFIAKRNTTVEEVNDILKKAAEDKHWEKIFSVTEDPIVSSDIIGSKFASIADLGLTRVVDGNLVKVMAWYDNEVGYAHVLTLHVVKTASFL
ncbi:MAG: Glyceraldehyde 3-phosphate dehydrogenase [Parcubacteria group bacterium GW2011_GWF2_39_8b]|nr:MAG: Glyceraldehyde 3-phosphate dehydrogenase [Parcubacteria group bacterium GW2011_GWF2_39_8b]